MVTVSALPMPTPSTGGVAITGRLMEHPANEQEVLSSDTDRPPYIKATDVLRPGAPGAKDTWLRFFHSYQCDAEVASRSFCGRCGSPVAFHYRPRAEYYGQWFRSPDGWEDVVDVMLGTVDKFCLDKDGMQVEHDMTWSEAPSWSKRHILHGRSSVGARHPSNSLAEVI